VSEPAHPARFPALVVGDDLRLERWLAEAVEPVQRLVERSRLTLSEFLPWAMAPVTVEEEAKAQVDSEAKWRAGEMVGWTIVEDGAIRGMLGLHRRGGPDELEIGYWLDDEAVGRGIMTRACTLATDVAFATDGISVVEIIHDAANARSAAVPARLGYRRTDAFSDEAKARLESGIKVRWCTWRDEWLAAHPISSVRHAE
jgi:ribosomal-protein-serine acetyltransferase